MVVLKKRDLMSRIESHCTKINGCWMWHGATTVAPDKSLRPVMKYKTLRKQPVRHLYDLPIDARLRKSCLTNLCQNPKHFSFDLPAYINTLLKNNQWELSDVTSDDIIVHMRIKGCRNPIRSTIEAALKELRT